MVRPRHSGSASQIAGHKKVSVRLWPDPEMVDRQVRPGLTDRYLVDTGRSSAIFRCFLKE
jgi:hypothetical protein